ncbi:MAG TPA: 4-hydroxybenzoate 3-monooxygenase [Kofleriaceae bacterium]|nr:4-hydroxybenzoate 3-monooxygenase [Kofleriaceae bacterium]
MHVQVGIVGGGPAGLLLSHLLARAGIESVVLERRSRAELESEVRAGVLEQGTVDLLTEVGVGDRLRREGAVHRGLYLQFAGRRHRIALADLAGGRAITLYAQHEVIKDLIAARLAAGGALRFEARAVAIHAADTDRPRITYRAGDAEHELTCDFLAGCDGFHGPCRQLILAAGGRAYERTYPTSWFGVLAEAPRSTDELIYALHERGFALVSTRSPTLQRLYFQCRPDDDASRWSDARVWEELQARLALDGWTLREGTIIDKSVIAMRSVVIEPMQHRRVFLAGDAAHIVPPTGAKGLNLAAADVHVLAHALAAFYARGRTDLLDAYSAICLARVWAAQRFSAAMTAMLHRLPDDDDTRFRLQLAELAHVTSSAHAAAALAESYVGLPFPALAPTSDTGAR